MIYDEDSEGNWVERVTVRREARPGCPEGFFDCYSGGLQ